MTLGQAWENQQPPDIAALDGAAIQQAAQRYLDTQTYVKLSRLPAGQ